MDRKLNKEATIKLIFAELEKGKTYTDTFEVILSKVKLSEPTFASYWKAAKQIHAKQQSLIEAAKLKETINQAVEETREDILNKNQALVILTDITKDIWSKPTDKVAAIRQMCDMMGWHTPTENILHVFKQNETVGYIVPANFHEPVHHSEN